MERNIAKWLEELKSNFPDLDLLPAASLEVLRKTEEEVGKLPANLAKVLEASNGLTCRSFRLLSALDPSNPKKTWESLQRANDPKKSDALGRANELHERFLVFADIGNGYAMFDREDQTIWFAESGDTEIQQTDLSFEEFISVMLERAE